MVGVVASSRLLSPAITSQLSREQLLEAVDQWVGPGALNNKVHRLLRFIGEPGMSEAWAGVKTLAIAYARLTHADLVKFVGQQADVPEHGEAGRISRDLAQQVFRQLRAPAWVVDAVLLDADLMPLLLDARRRHPEHGLVWTTRESVAGTDLTATRIGSELRDYVRGGGVCKAWRGAVQQALRSARLLRLSQVLRPSVQRRMEGMDLPGVGEMDMPNMTSSSTIPEGSTFFHGPGTASETSYSARGVIVCDYGTSSLVRLDHRRLDDAMCASITGGRVPNAMSTSWAAELGVELDVSVSQPDAMAILADGVTAWVFERDPGRLTKLRLDTGARSTEVVSDELSWGMCDLASQGNETLLVCSCDQDGQSGRRAGVVSGHHTLLGLQLKARGCPPHP